VQASRGSGAATTACGHGEARGNGVLTLVCGEERRGEGGKVSEDEDEGVVATLEVTVVRQVGPTPVYGHQMATTACSRSATSPSL
jgi:hypothetical protein